MTDDTRVPVPLRTPLEAAMAAAKPYKPRMVDRELQEKLDEAATAGKWLAGVWHLGDNGQTVHQFCKTLEYPLSELRVAAWLFVAEIMRRMMPDETGPVNARPWGCWWPIIETEHCHADLLYIAAGGHSSIHRHMDKINVFAALMGPTTVELYDGNAESQNLAKTHYVRAGLNPLVVAPRQAHRFLAREQHSLILELSLPQPGPLTRADIDRWSQAGHGAD